MKSLSDLWDSILARLSGELSDTTIKTWFDEISVVTMEDSALVLHCSNAFKKNTVEARFLPQIKAALKDIFSTDMEVKILNDEQLAAYHGVAPDQPGDLFDSDAFTFETYVVGPRTSWPTPPPNPWRRSRRRATTPCSSTAIPVWARPICCTPSPIW